jgi:hypothetical protein
MQITKDPHDGKKNLGEKNKKRKRRFNHLGGGDFETAV